MMTRDWVKLPSEVHFRLDRGWLSLVKSIGMKGFTPGVKTSFASKFSIVAPPITIVYQHQLFLQFSREGGQFFDAGVDATSKELTVVKNRTQ